MFTRDDVAIAGPLAHFATRRWSDRNGAWDEFNFELLLALASVHMLVVLMSGISD